MLPHGRRRPSSPWLLCLSLFSLLFSSAAAAVLGIDLGTEYIKAALVNPGIPLDIVLTKDSKRKEAAAVAFKPVHQASSSDKDIYPERAYGGDAVALSARFPGDSYLNLKPLLGREAASKEVETYKERYPGLKVVPSHDRGMVSFQSATFEPDEIAFPVEELLAMELQNIKSNAEALAKSKIRDVVIALPAFYTAEEKRAVQVAAELAGLQVLQMVTDGLAVGVNYAMTRTFPVPAGDAKPELHIVYDMGAGSATATVLRFQGRNVKDVGKFNKTVQEVQVLGTGWDKTLGGDALNTIIMNDMLRKFAESPNLKALGASLADIKAHARTVSKLWKESERMRQVLSANTETQASFEGLYQEDISFKYKITRADFEKMADEYAGRVPDPIKQALEMAAIELSDIESIIVHGGATRTPFVQKALEGVIGNPEKVRTNVNSDEAACFGAAFQAAGLSPSFRVKEIRAIEASVHVVGVSWEKDGKPTQYKLFVPSSQVGPVKQFPFKKTEDFTFGLYQQVFQEGSETKIPVWDVKTVNLTKAVQELNEKIGCPIEDVKTQFGIKLSPIDGLPDVVQGTVSCEVVDGGKKGSVVDGVKGLFGFGSKKGDQEPLVDGEGAETVTSSEAETATGSSLDPKSTAGKEDEKAKEPKKKTETLNVGFLMEVVGRPQIGHMELFRIEDRLKSFDKSDQNRKDREEAVNVLEGYAYRVRDMIADEGFMAASTPKQRAEIEENAKSASEWLYGEGSEAKKKDLQARLKELKSLVEPIQKRKEEASKRPELVTRLQESLGSTKLFLESLKDTAEKASVAAAEASLSATATSSSSADSTTAAASSDDFADLEDDTSSTSTSTSTSTSSIPTPLPPIYSPEDFTSAFASHDKIKEWLEEKLTAQTKLSPTEEPALTVAELEVKISEAGRITMLMLQKKLNIEGFGKSSSSKTKSKTKTKTKTKKTKTKSTTTTPVESSTVTVTATSTSIRDEL